MVHNYGFGQLKKHPSMMRLLLLATEEPTLLTKGTFRGLGKGILGARARQESRSEQKRAELDMRLHLRR